MVNPQLDRKRPIVGDCPDWLPLPRPYLRRRGLRRSAECLVPAGNPVSHGRSEQPQVIAKMGD